MNPHVDFHALAPEIVLTATIILVLVVDLFTEDPKLPARVATFGVLGSLVPVLTLAVSGHTRVLFGGAFVVDNYSLVLTGFFLVAAYVTLLVSFDYIGEGDYYQGEYYVLLLTSVLGMVVISSARDLISLFVALETITIPTFVLAAWRKHDTKSNEAGLKYFLIGALSSAIMLYGMSIVFGLSNSTVLAEIHRYATRSTPALFAVAVFLTLVGFAFKVSAVPFHFWAPDTYEGAPTPITAFLSVASKAGGFVALLTIVRLGFFPSADSWQPILWVLAAAVDDAREPRRAATDQRGADARLLLHRPGRLHPRAARRRGRRPRQRRLGGGRHLHPHLRGHEPRRVRLGDRRGPPHRLGGHVHLPGPRPHQPGDRRRVHPLPLLSRVCRPSPGGSRSSSCSGRSSRRTRRRPWCSGSSPR